jgi:small subunit ribosomal protein S14
MAKVSLIQREYKKKKTVEKYKEKYLSLKLVLKNSQTSYEQREQARIELQKLPRNAYPVRLTNRCVVTGRARGFFRFFGLARSEVRNRALSGQIPGVTKASW